ncbi:CRISPR-associated protein Cas2 [Neisseria sp. HSC-16F19]|nr:hypothetical protein [Neisseria sp. HSC-16F19]MCP2041863.1 CRISPR-associated protein Cas2 [Neisseria sp. HSC-16F19]
MTQRRFYLFAYDIADRRRRTRVQRLLRGYAVGGQKSLFECWLTTHELNGLCHTLPPLLDVGDRLHVLSLGRNPAPVYYGGAASLRYDPFILA